MIVKLSKIWKVGSLQTFKVVHNFQPWNSWVSRVRSILIKSTEKRKKWWDAVLSYLCYHDNDKRILSDIVGTF